MGRVVNPDAWTTFSRILGITGLSITALGWLPYWLHIRQGVQPGDSAVGFGILAWLSTVVGIVLIALAFFTAYISAEHRNPAVTRGFQASTLDALVPGMSRSDIERDIGVPIATWRHRATSGGEELTYLAYSKRHLSGSTYYDVVVLSQHGTLVRTEKNYNPS